MRHLWRKTWLHAGHVSELPQPGSYKLFEQLGLSIIISRGLDGELKAFHNICRHRASALLMEKQGISSVLMGYQERALYWYQEEIDRQIGPENIPAHLRIKPVLAHHVSN
jgi:hypothetical protein